VDASFALANEARTPDQPATTILLGPARKVLASSLIGRAVFLVSKSSFATII
jgi:hypothetical protein